MRKENRTGAFDIPQEPLYITPPRKKLLSFLAIPWLIILALCVMPVQLLPVAIIPAGAILVIIFTRFSRAWKAHGYSRTALYFWTAVFALLCICISLPIQPLYNIK